MNDIELIKKINNFFLHNIRTQLAIIVSGTELLDFEQEFLDIKDSINFSSFLIDCYDAILGVLLDSFDGKYFNENFKVFSLGEKVKKLAEVFNNFKSNNVFIDVKIIEDGNAECNLIVVKNLLSIIIAEAIKYQENKLLIEIKKKSVFIHSDVKDIPEVLFDINKIMENYGVLLYKSKECLEVRIK
ncbi:hypothetical protein DEFDS_1648 [Deferribacter desulfuricans SSM1]|uniref:Uncharacterized protein n=1 Tax=Deferribacter desulfuricans (strain DSM 14783 / JCM 11476 / NBRC 101012 / SSM1) TaxID=639282 RepID=D3P8R4_DEFDS|nr:hypothetical protein [Deferribacter desulfuricans]BAI81104.1 hypothetical protein DEFDS_1648 [Deferribacter desulfuricans SSM1]